MNVSQPKVLFTPRGINLQNSSLLWSAVLDELTNKYTDSHIDWLTSSCLKGYIFKVIHDKVFTKTFLPLITKLLKTLKKIFREYIYNIQD